MQKRRAGVLLHPTSLPGKRDIGELDQNAYRFVEFLKASGQTVWQMLPLGPTHADKSPYQSMSSHAGNPALISLVPLKDAGWLSDAEIDKTLAESSDIVVGKRKLIALALKHFKTAVDEGRRSAFADFRKQHSYWLEDFALYIVIKQQYEHRGWSEWPVPLRNRDKEALLQVETENRDALDAILFEQFLFYEQWHALKKFANDNDVLLFGDLPIFVAHDSADVWAHRDQFRLDETGKPTVVAGVPPDYFSETGQRWGNPHYDWAKMDADGYRWWKERIKTQLTMFDWIRIDHFRGFEAYWVVPAEHETAMHGYWEKGPAEKFFHAMQTEFGEKLPLIAEDLGVITPEVDALRKQFKLPGMKILQFAFDGGPTNPYLPHNHAVNSVVYTGTHDNNTTLGWYNELHSEKRSEVYAYFGDSREHMPWLLIRAALASVARTAIVPMQDYLELDSEDRMNTPGTTKGNWEWQFEWKQVPDDLAEKLRRLTDLYGRA